MVVNMVLLRIEELAIGYERPLVENIELEIVSPSFIQIMGPNGSGKTTFLRTLIGVLKPIKGRIYIDGEDVTGNTAKSGKYISYVPQIATYVLGEVFPITVWEFIEFEATVYAKTLNIARESIRKMVKEILELIGIPRELWYKGVHKLSGGQRQRLLIARALVKDVPMIVMDEPLSAIDVEGKIVVANLIKVLRDREKIVITTCHDPSMLIEHTDYVMILSKGSYIYGKPEEVLKSSVLEKVYRGCFTEYEKHIHLYDYHL
uniref:Metal ABC transporter ATP-binding protein n=1 Tax=Ignisphaera aggregans TaxID=334771 RepID=A0A7C4H4F0_9CREN